MVTIIHQKDKYGMRYCLFKSDGEPINHAYAIGFSRPHYPMPAILTAQTETGLRFSVCRWFENFDGFWNYGESRARGISH